MRWRDSKSGRRGRRPLQIPCSYLKNKKTPRGCFLFFGGEQGIFPRLPPLSPRFARWHVGENSPPDCFLPQLRCSLLVRIPCPYLKNKKNTARVFFIFWRRARDSNPRTGYSPLHDFQSCSFGQLGQLSVFCLIIIQYKNINCKSKYYVL